MAVTLMERDLDCGMLSDGFEELDGFDGSEELVAEDIDQEYLDQFLWDTAIYASVCIDKFFEDKEMYGGGPVPKRLLRSPRYLSLVINSTAEVVPYLYSAMERCSHSLTQEKPKLATVPNDVKLVISILRNCYLLGIPQRFVFGMTLMYLEICEGVQVIDY